MTDVASKVNNILSEYLKGDKKRAYLQLKKISKNYPLNEKLKFNLAFIEQDQGNVEDAKRSYLELINNFLSFYNLLFRKIIYFPNSTFSQVPRILCHLLYCHKYLYC